MACRAWDFYRETRMDRRLSAAELQAAGQLGFPNNTRGLLQLLDGDRSRLNR